MRRSFGRRHFFIGGNNGVPHIEAALIDLGMRRTVSPDCFFLKWVECQNNIDYRSFSPGDQIVNHIQNISNLTKKDGLLLSLREYEILMKKKGFEWKLSDIFMETYHLDKPTEYKAFKQVFKDGEIWICKPCGKNQGKGIFLVNDVNQLELITSEKGQVARQALPVKRIIQRYINNPLLINGFKFDIRAYMLISSTDPFIVFYHHGYIRLTCVPYSTDSLDLHIHLTNQYVQKKHHLYAEKKEETVLCFEQFNEYINSQVKEKKGLMDNWVFSYLVPEIKKIMLTCFKSVQDKLPRKVGTFELLGYDFMIDSEMKVWLIEVNINPALFTNCNVLKSVLPPMIKETLNIVVEVFDKKKRRDNILPITNAVSFEPIYFSHTKFEFKTEDHS